MIGRDGNITYASPAVERDSGYARDEVIGQSFEKFALPDDRANASLRVKASDTGNGIPVDMRESIFDPFDRLGTENSTTPGTGIGLSVSKQLIEYMGGDIRFDSTIGEGSTFWIEVPVATAAPLEFSPVF